jgi:hypothetical protein
MSEELLFAAIGGVKAEWRDRNVNVPVRYFEARNFAISFRTPLDVVRGLVPDNVHPLRWGRSEAVTSIVFSDFLDSDIGGYQEVAIGFPVSVGEAAPPYLGLRSFLKRGGAVFIHQMVLDDQDAIDLGVEMAGYPKRFGEIELDLDSFMIKCLWREDGEEVLTITAPRPDPTPVDKRDRMDYITVKDGYVLRSQSVGYVGSAGRVDGEVITVEPGNHARVAGICQLLQGKCLGGRLVLDRQLALSQPLEAWR